MTVRASVSRNYLLRLGGIALACCAVGFWFLYDGAIAYPRQRTRAVRYLEFVENDQLERWEEFATEQGWSTEDPGEPKSEYDIAFQYVIGGLSLSVSVFYMLAFLSYRGRWIEMNEDGLRTNGGKVVAFHEITAVDKRRWDDKGIVKISFAGEQGKGRLVLDDWKFEDEPIEAMLKAVEDRTSGDKITGGVAGQVADQTTEGDPEPPAN